METNKKQKIYMSDSDLISEAYNQQILNEGIIDRARAGLNNSLVGRAVNAVGDVATGNFKGAYNKLTQSGEGNKLDTLLKSHGPVIQKAINALITDISKTGTIEQGLIQQLGGELYNTFIQTLKSSVDQQNALGKGISAVGQGISNAASSIGDAATNTGQGISNAAKAVGGALSNPLQTVASGIGKAGAAVANMKNTATNAYNQNRINNTGQTQTQNQNQEEQEEDCWVPGGSKNQGKKRKFFTKTYNS